LLAYSIKNAGALHGSDRVSDGKPLWSFALGGTCHAAPVAAAGLLVVGCDDGSVYAFRGKGP
jgi:outer membrane protein assembly factor BamB